MTGFGQMRISYEDMPKCVLRTRKNMAFAAVSSALAIIATLVIVGAVIFAVYGLTSTTGVASKSSTRAITSVTTIVSSQSSIGTLSGQSSTTRQCYQGALPINSTSTIILNDTREWFSVSGSYLPPAFKVGAYGFTINPSESNATIPQFFINVTNSQGQTQSIEVTNLGSWDGQSWPPDMPLNETFFGGNATLQWLFLCDGHNVFIVAATR
jgi:hypothetical protein